MTDVKVSEATWESLANAVAFADLSRRLLRLPRVFALKTLIICAALFGSCLQLSGIVAQPTILERITANGDRNVGVELTATARITPRIAIATAPDRLIIDLPDALPGASLGKIIVNRGKLRDIRVSLLSANPRMTRIVLDLFEPIPYRLSPLRNALVIHLGEEDESAAAPIGAITKLPVQTRLAESLPKVVTPPPALFSPAPSRARWILPILTMTTVLAMLVVALMSHIQNKRMRRGL